MQTRQGHQTLAQGCWWRELLLTRCYPSLPRERRRSAAEILIVFVIDASSPNPEDLWMKSGLGGGKDKQLARDGFRVLRNAIEAIWRGLIPPPRICARIAPVLRARRRLKWREYWCPTVVKRNDS